jgi:hypothetical protein
MTDRGWFLRISQSLLLALVAGSCSLDGVHPSAPVAVIKSLAATDTLGNPSTSFRSGDMFFLEGTVANNTGEAQGYSYTAPLMDILIFRADTAVASPYWHIAWPQVVVKGVFPRDSTLSIKWKAPRSSQRNSNLPLQPGSYVVKFFFGAHFDSAIVLGVDTLEIAIIP